MATTTHPTLHGVRSQLDATTQLFIRSLNGIRQDQALVRVTALVIDARKTAVRPVLGALQPLGCLVHRTRGPPQTQAGAVAGQARAPTPALDETHRALAF